MTGPIRLAVAPDGAGPEDAARYGRRDGSDRQHRRSLELFQSEVAPVLRRGIPSRPLQKANAR